MKILISALIMLGSFLSLNALEDKAIKEYDEAEMDKAIAHAKETVDKFIATVKSEKVRVVSVKVPIKDGTDTEHFWLSKIAINNDGSFTGVIDNDPDIVKNVKIGQKMTVKKSDISDWMYLKGGVMYGNFSLRVLWKKMPQNEKDELLKQFKFSDEK